jgi:hypothetical protein
MLRSDIPVALQCHLFIDYDDVLGVDCDQTPADVGRFVIPFKCQVILAGLVVTETCAGGTTTPVAVFDKRPTAGSDGSRGAADIASFVLSTTAAGKVIYDEVAVGTVLNPGDEVIVELTVQATGGGAAGHFVPFLLVEQIPETKANLTDMVATA